MIVYTVGAPPTGHQLVRKHRSDLNEVSVWGNGLGHVDQGGSKAGDSTRRHRPLCGVCFNRDPDCPKKSWDLSGELGKMLRPDPTSTLDASGRSDRAAR